MMKRQVKGVVGYFNCQSHTIFMIENLENKKKVLQHEILHLLNHLYITVDNKIIIKQYYDSKGLGYSLNEGFTEWLKAFLYETNPNSYIKQVKDLEIIRHILHKTKAEMVTLFVNYDYNETYNQLSCYLKKADIDQLIRFLDKELESEKDPTIRITTSEIQTKYDQLLSAMIVSHFSRLNSKEIYDIARIFQNSIFQYFNEIYDKNKILAQNINDYLNKRVLTTLLRYGTNSNNTIKIVKQDNELLLYYDINHLYLAVNSKNNTFKFVEESFDTKGQAFYTDVENVERKDFSMYQFYLIKDLVEDIDSLKTISIKQIKKAYQQKINSSNQKRLFLQ